MNSEGCTLSGPNLYQLLAPLIIGVIGVSGIIMSINKAAQSKNTTSMYISLIS